MTDQEQRLIVSRALDIGERMLLSGGEVSRVEDTVSRILKSYGAERVEVFTILSFISLTAVFDGEIVLTENRRVSIVAYSNDFTRMEQLNALSREVCATLPALPVLEEKLVKSAANICCVKTSLAANVNTYDVLYADKLVVDLDGAKKLEEVFA